MGGVMLEVVVPCTWWVCPRRWRRRACFLKCCRRGLLQGQAPLEACDVHALDKITRPMKTLKETTAPNLWRNFLSQNALGQLDSDVCGHMTWSGESVFRILVPPRSNRNLGPHHVISSSSTRSSSIQQLLFGKSVGYLTHGWFWGSLAMFTLVSDQACFGKCMRGWEGGRKSCASITNRGKGFNLPLIRSSFESGRFGPWKPP